jgi:TolB protein
VKPSARLLASIAMSFTALLSTAGLAQDIEEEKRAVVKITSQADGVNRVGTGFIANLGQDAAFIVTASHVIEGDSKPQVAFYPDATKTRQATIIGTEGDLPRGLALIRVDGPLPHGLSHLGIDASFNLEASEQVTIIGFPRLAATAWAVTPITIVGRQGTAITFTGAADEGSSGSPVIRNGWVTALVAEKSGDFGFAVPGAAVRFALEGWGLKLTPDQSVPRSAHALPTTPTGKLSNTRILFTSNRDMDVTGNNFDLYVMDIDGRNVKRVSPQHKIDPEDAGWSRDGTSITYVTKGDPTTNGIYQTELATGKTTKFTRDMAYFRAPLWSPDGSRIAFLANTSIGPDNQDVFVMPGSGGNVKRLTHNPSHKVSLFWSPDGNEIGFAELTDKKCKTFFISVDGTRLEQLSSPLTDFAGGSWSVATNKIIGESKREGYAAIYTLNRDGSDPVRLTNTPQGDMQPDWSPDGTKIVFTSRRDGHAEIYVMNADGSNQVRLTSGHSFSYNPQWSPFLK